MLRDRRHRLRPSAALTMLLLGSLLLVACNGGTATRLETALGKLATTLGKSADDIERELRAAHPNLADEALAAKAEQLEPAVKVRLDEIALTGVRAAEQREARARAIYNATCKFVSALETDGSGEISPADELIINELRAQALSPSQQLVDDVRDAVATQALALKQTNNYDYPAMLKDFGCLAAT